MNRENLLEKYDLSKEEFEEAIEQGVKLGNICSVPAMIALTELLCHGDIEKSIEK